MTHSGMPPARTRKYTTLRARRLPSRERLFLEGGGYRQDHLRALAQRVELADDGVHIYRSGAP